MTNNLNDKLGGVRCRGCNKKHEQYLIMQVLIAAPGGGATAVSLLICPGCGHVFVPADILEKMNEAVRAAGAPKIIEGEASKLIKVVKS